MWEKILNWPGIVVVDGEKFDSVADAQKRIDLMSKSVSSILLQQRREDVTEREKTSVESVQSATQYRISVRQYMTKRSSPDFDFMAKWNNDIPMPLRTMVGTIEKETRGMIYVKLHGDITAKTTQYCMKCGRLITNPISQYFGMGPECGGHNYINPFSSDEELRRSVNEYRKNYLQKITWEGWIIKSAITEKEEVNYCASERDETSIR